VVTPQPISATSSAGRSVRTATTIAWSVISSSAKVPSPEMPVTVKPSRRWPRLADITAPPPSQRFDRPWRQNQQSPQAGMNEQWTRSPTETRVTDSPISITVPAPSWPRITGSG
jgi:hypothetical protein